MAEPSYTGTREEWQRLADAVKARRAELRLTQTELADLDEDISMPVVQVVEGARQRNNSMAIRTMTGLSQALGWTAGSAYAVLRGEEPQEATDDYRYVLDLRKRLTVALSALLYLPEPYRTEGVEAAEAASRESVRRARQAEFAVAAEKGATPTKKGRKRGPSPAAEG